MNKLPSLPKYFDDLSFTVRQIDNGYIVEIHYSNKQYCFNTNYELLQFVAALLDPQIDDTEN